MKSLLLATSALVGAALPVMARADAVLDADQNKVEGVVVTGRSFNLQTQVAGRLGLTERETPAAIEVLTQEDIQAQGLRTAIEALNAAPGVVSGNLPGSVGLVSMRGFQRAVNYLYDGVRMPNSDAGVRNWDAWAFERIEVIKGPASVTSGEGALAGAINFVPRRPMLGQRSGEAFGSAGGRDSYRLAADLNAPVGDKAAVRGDVAWSRSDGWVDDTDSRTFTANLAVLLAPTDRLSVTLSADYYEDRFSTAYYGAPLVSAAAARDPSDLVSGSAGLVLDKALRRKNYDTADGLMDSQSVWLRARAEYKLSDAWTLVSDSSWYDADRLWRDSDDYSFNSASGRFDRATSKISHDHQFWSQRLHAAYDGQLAGRRNRFVVGAELGGTDFFTVRRFGTTTSVDPYAPVRGLFPADAAGNFSTRQNVWADVDSKALFVEDAYNLTPDLLLRVLPRLPGRAAQRRALAPAQVLSRTTRRPFKGPAGLPRPQSQDPQHRDRSRPILASTDPSLAPLRRPGRPVSLPVTHAFQEDPMIRVRLLAAAFAASLERPSPWPCPCLGARPRRRPPPQSRPRPAFVPARVALRAPPSPRS
jgi:iron complex outermembrane receptor protein